MEYRMEIDALNILVAEQKRTNELLEKLLSQKEEKKEQILREKTVKRGPRAK